MLRIDRRVVVLGLASAFVASSEAGSCAEKSREAEISAADIAWFRTLRSRWVGGDDGAPALLPPGAGIRDMETASIDAAFATRLQPVLCAFFLHAAFAPAHYVLHAPLDEHADVFVKDDNIKVLQRTRWITFGIDNKRPYGDYNHFEIDMARALGLPVTRNGNGEDEIAAVDEARMQTMHRKMQFVVQAYVENAELTPGRYFIPDDGWDVFISPLCRPVSAARVAAYERTMAEIDARHGASPADLIPDKIAAKLALFAPD